MRLWLFLVLAGAVLLAWPAWAGDGLVALQTAASSCRTTTTPPPRYVDCRNGTVTDNLTGLVWLKNANCIGAAGAGSGDPPGRVDWRTAMEFVAGLSDNPPLSAAATHDCRLSDGSSPGEWRLPSAGEWETMIADAAALGCRIGVFGGPSITDDSGEQCWQEGPGNSFTGVVSSSYFSATTWILAPEFVFVVDLSEGSVPTGAAGKGPAPAGYVWPVRGGQ